MKTKRIERQPPLLMADGSPHLLPLLTRSSFYSNAYSLSLSLSPYSFAKSIFQGSKNHLFYARAPDGKKPRKRQTFFFVTTNVSVYRGGGKIKMIFSRLLPLSFIITPLLFHCVATHDARETLSFMSINSIIPNAATLSHSSRVFIFGRIN